MTKGGNTRFCKGQSGNPNGRPRKQKAVEASPSAFDVVLEKTLTVTQSGVERELTVEEALLLRTYQDALAGSRPARSRILAMILRRERWLGDHTRVNRSRPAEYIVKKDPQNANAALLLLGIAARDEDHFSGTDRYERLLLEPWVVKAALRRGRNLGISEGGIEEVRRSTRSPDKLVWP